MKVVEIFASRQGEGLWTGVESVFVRTAGCNLRCRFCDTAYAFNSTDEELDLSVEEIIGKILMHGRRHVVLTGGEPMLHSELVPLTKLLRKIRMKITIETSGTLDLPVCCDLISISPKLPNSTPIGASEQIRRRHEYNRKQPDVVPELMRRYDYQLKFVVDSPMDFHDIESYLSELPKVIAYRVLLMPQAVDVETMKEKEPWIMKYAKKNGFRYCPRMQLEWYGNRRGT